MVEQWNNHDGTVDYLMVEQWNRDGGTIEHLMVEQWINHAGRAEHLIVEQGLWNSRTSDGAKVPVEKYKIGKS